MEFANQLTPSGKEKNGVRVGEQKDASALTDLLRQAAYAHLHADWHYPADWLGSPGFIVAEKDASNEDNRSLANRLFGSSPQFLACFAVAAEPPPGAWVRVAAVADTRQSREILPAMFAKVVEYLRQESVTKLGWLLVEKWPDSWLEELGFVKEKDVETFVKAGGKVPAVESAENLSVRPLRKDDLQRLEEIEAAAFEPLWRHCVSSLTLARRYAISFDVAELDGQLIGYQFSTAVESGAHLSRMTVDPAYQGIGVGTLLLAHAFEGYRQQGIDHISLNTQSDNLASQKLYRRFGFKRNGQKFPVWVVDI